MKNRFFSIVLVIVMTAALLAGCGSNSGKTKNAEAATKEQIEDAKVKLEKLISVENAARDLSSDSEAGEISNMHFQGKVGTTVDMEVDGIGITMDYYITSDEILDYSTPGAFKVFSKLEFINSFKYTSFSDEVKAMLAEAEAQGIDPFIYEGYEYGVKSTLKLFFDTEAAKVYLDYYSSGSIDPSLQSTEKSRKIWADFSAGSVQAAYDKIMATIGSELSLKELLDAIVGENNRLFVNPDGTVKIEKAVDDSEFKNVVYELKFIDDNNYSAVKSFDCDNLEIYSELSSFGITEMGIKGTLSVTPTEEKVTTTPSDYESFEEVHIGTFISELQEYMQEEFSL